jgi:hypothetical protein
MANFSETQKKNTWEKSQTVDKMDPAKYRKDVCGAWIVWESFGTETDFGWGIDHALPQSKGGTDHADNIRAMHWRNNRSKADDFPTYKIAVTAKEAKNVEVSETRTVSDSTLKALKALYPTNQILIGIETKA